jgi:hypothetical protein
MTMINLSENERWERLAAVAGLLDGLRRRCPEAQPAPEQILDDRTLLGLLCRMVKATGLDEIGPLLDGPLSEWTAAALGAAGKDDHAGLLEAIQALEAEGEEHLLAGFRFWPPSLGWDWLAEDLVAGYLPTITALCLQGWIGEFLPEGGGLEELDVSSHAPALALSLAPYLRLREADWDDYAEIAAHPLKALLVAYFDYTDNVFLGEAARGEALPEFVAWVDAPGLAADFRQAEPVWDARPREEDLADPWYVFCQALRAFPIGEPEDEPEEPNP